MKIRVSYWACQISGWGTYTALGMVMAAKAVGWRPSVMAGYGLFFLYSIALTDLLRRDMRRREWIAGSAARRFLYITAAAAVVGSIQTFLVLTINLAFERHASMLQQPLSIVSVWISVTSADWVWALFYLVLTFRRRAQEREVRFELALKEAELRALEAQINPHFLFNSLNSIRGLIAEDPAQAQDMITRLANLLRYNLHRDMEHTVPLASEVEVVSDYLALESVRFEERLRIALAVEQDAAMVGVPPMLLQTLVENALKHGIARLPAGGDLSIAARLEADTLVLEVANSGQLAEASGGKSTVGLKNASERLRLIYGGRASLRLANRDPQHVAATVLIPRTI